jgi:hypothetical protein
VQAQFLDRTAEGDLLAVEAEAVFGGRVGGVTGGDGAIERAASEAERMMTNCCPSSLRGQRLGLFLGFEVARLELCLAVLERLDVGVVGAQGLFLRQKEVAGVAVLDGSRPLPSGPAWPRVPEG